MATATVLQQFATLGVAMNLWKRSTGVWYILYYQDGIRHQHSTKTKNHRKALVYLSNFEKHINKPTNITLSAFIERLLKYSQVNKSAKSAENGKRALNWFFNINGNKALTAITVGDVEYFKAIRLKTVSKTTVNIDLRTCRAAMNVAVKWGYLEANPFTHAPQRRLPEKERAYLTSGEIKQLLQAINQSWLYNIVVFALNTGMRRGEIINLLWTDVDVNKRIIDIRNNDYFHVKGGKNRKIPINETVSQLLPELHQNSKYVFPNQSKDRICPRYLTRRFKLMILRAGLNSEIHFHHLRHTFATMMIQRGVPIYEVQQLLGHSRVTTTQIYSHLGVDDLRASVEVVSKLF